MAKATTHFVCSSCGYDTVKWMGKCPSCGEWNTLEEFSAAPEKPKAASAAKRGGAVPISDVQASGNLCVPTGIAEFDRVLGGGVFEDSLVLVGGEPGVGKSTLLLQALGALSNAGGRALYVSGEESSRQIKLRAGRVGVSGGLLLLAETEISSILSCLEENTPRYVVVDSIQTLYDANSASSPGSVSQIRECASKLNAYAKSSGAAVILIGHVTKEGSLAGPRVLEHMVDTVLYFEGSSAYRILRTVKNRFGSTNEIGVFEMLETGMREVTDFSALFIEGMEKGVPGSCVYCALEGSRPVLVEIQALVTKTAFQNPKRMSAGLDYYRSALICAVLEKRAGLALFDQDIYINVAGGLRVSEPAADLALALAIVSSFKNKCANNFAAIGEVGLTGEVRSVAQLDRRVAECAKMGFTRVIAPKTQLKYCAAPNGVELIGAKNIWDALERVFSK